MSNTAVKKRLKQLFAEKNNLISVYFTAGFPGLDNTRIILKALQEAGADFVEIGIPFSDPVADGPTIQASSKKALENGMSVKLLLQQLKDIQDEIEIPFLLMSYINPVLQYGIERFCKEISGIGAEGLILPDLPFDIYQKEYKQIFDHYSLHNVFLISPQTEDDRIRLIDQNSEGFIYMVSSSSTTGAKKGISDDQVKYFKRVKDLDLQNPLMIGFGISDHQSFKVACKYAQGAIVGSAFIKMLEQSNNLEEDIKSFIKKIKEG